ncbi:hypothetical protein E4U54_006261, partial [Claviceps lovelessii]
VMMRGRDVQSEASSRMRPGGEQVDANWMPCMVPPPFFAFGIAVSRNTRSTQWNDAMLGRCGCYEDVKCGDTCSMQSADTAAV